MNHPSPFRKLAALLVLTLLVLILSLAAQAPNEGVRVSSRSYVPGLPAADPLLLQVAVVVRDSKGQTVPDLKAANFQVLDQGKDVPVTGVTPVVHNTKDPLYIALCFDDYLSSPATLQRAKFIATRFIQNGINPGDMVAVATTFYKQTLDFTSDKAKIQGAIERVQQQATPSATQTEISQPGRMPGGGTTGGANRLGAQSAPGADTSFAEELTAKSFLTVIGTFESTMARLPGNRLIVMFSPGFSGAPERDADRVIAQAMRAGVVINVLDTKSSFTEGAAGAGTTVALPVATYTTDPSKLGLESSMADFAHSTGGLFFHHNGDPFSHGFRELGVLPETSYILAMRPDAGDTKYHRLRIQLNNVQLSAAAGGNQVQARSGFFPLVKGAAAETAESQEIREKVDQQIVSMQPVADFPSTVGVQYNKLANGNTGVQVVLHVDLKAVPFGTLKDKRTQKLTLVAAILDQTGKLITGREGQMDFAVSEAKYKSLVESGVTLTLNLETPPGTYRLSTVAEAQGKLSSTLNAIQVP